MTKNVDVGWAGSVTVFLLCVATAFLLHNFYKRFQRIQKRAQEERDEN